VSDRDLSHVTDFIGPSGNVTDKYGRRNPLTRTLLASFLDEIDALIDVASPSSILDVGCGEGVVTERLANRTGASTVGVDLGDEVLQKEWGHRESELVSFRAASAYNLPFADGSFDCVCALEVLEHLERPRDALAEMARVARRTLLVSVPREPIWRVAHFVARRDVRRLGNTPGHINHWSSRAFEQLVSEFGHVTRVRRPFPWTVVLAEPDTPTEARSRPRRTHMKVLSITSSYPRYDGDPTAPFMESISRHVAARGHEVHVLLPANREWSRPATEGGVHFHPYRYSPLRSWTPWGYSESLQAGVKIRRPLYALAPLVLLSALRASKSLLSRERFDLVHAHWVVPNGPIGALIARRHKLPLVISLHGSDISVAQRSGWIGRLTRSSFARAAAVTAPSEDLLERARSLGATGLLELIPYGADVDAFVADSAAAARIREQLGLDGDHTVVCAIGRFVHWKGFDYLIEAFAKASFALPEMHLLFVGDGDLREDLEARAKSLGVSQKVTFAGMASRHEMPGYLTAADIVVVPSIHYDGYVDGLPNVALEAMAAGKPLVATRVGGLPQLVQSGENGLLVDERDPDALADAIIMLARDPDLRRRLGENGRTLIRDSMNWDVVAERFEAVYERVTRGQTRGV